MENQDKIPGRDTWKDLSLMQLYDTKTRLGTLYYNMRRAGASNANNFIRLIAELDDLIQYREMEQSGM